MSKKMKSLELPPGYMSQAVSDGELNMSRLSSGGSSHSLGSGFTSGVQSSDGVASRVVSWAVGFEKLLEDPTGVEYFTAFLKSEVSAENILFWQACEQYRQIPHSQVDELRKEARLIYNTYLSDSSFDAVNIDDTARIDESALEHPVTSMFQKAQDQIFKLMKFDSYARFVRSPLYQRCMLASVEGTALPSLGNSKGSSECVTPTSHRKKLEPRLTSSETKANRKKRLEKRGSWGADVSFQRGTITRNESQISVKSTSSIELGFMFSKSENGRTSLWDADLISGGGSSSILGRAEKYCYVNLPDGAGSLVPTKPGQPLREMLGGLCDKRGFPLKDVVIYLQGKDKQPLSLEQDSSVLSDQQVFLEVRVTIAVRVKFTGKTVGIVVKSSKTLRDALATLLQKYDIQPQDAFVTMSGSQQPLKLSSTVFRLANKTICLDRVQGNTEGQRSPQDVFQKASPRSGKSSDMDGLLEMLSRAQSNRVEDQRGLLRKEHLVIPPFLKLSKESEVTREDQSLRQGATGATCSKQTGQAVEGDSSGLSSASDLDGFEAASQL
ncbi:regulator of G-protein signaling 14a isoform X2 [Clupea harengus]|uniref:Regulator of G-protein signaling 14a isoform X2 n=1 Tax=Clupea harengus TaxID=7950 RepID=A0A6P3VLX4_CLUHA|nr:regulator of G-protein signaling 14a isoform X2 [Clupea harengus]